MFRRFLSRVAYRVGRTLLALPFMFAALGCIVHFEDHPHQEAWLGMGGVVEAVGFVLTVGATYGIWARSWRYAALGLLGAIVLMMMVATGFPQRLR